MPNKYSHALVLSHYESRGLISFPHRHPPRPANPEPSHAERKSRPSSSAAAAAAAAVKVPSSPPRTPLPPLPPSLCPPSTTHDGDSVPSSSSHRATPSIITEIYAPQQPPSSVTPLNPVPLQSRLEPQSAQISPVTTKGNSLTSETSYLAEATPRTSVSSVREAIGKAGDETGNGKPLQPPPSRCSNKHETSKKATGEGGVEEIQNRATSSEEGVTHTDDDTSRQAGTAAAAAPPPPPTLGIDRSPPKPPLEALIDNSKPHSCFYLDACSTRPWEDRSGTPPILRIPSRPPGSSGSSSPDDAAPPPISRHRRLIAAPTTTKKSDRLTIWTKPANKADRDARATPHIIRDLTLDVTPWEEEEESTAMTAEQLSRLRFGGEGKRVPDAKPWESSSVPSGTTAASEVKTDATTAAAAAAAAASKKSPRRKISRIRGPLSGQGRWGGNKKAAGTGREKKVPRDEGEVGMRKRESRLLSDSDEEFLAQFEIDGYFSR